MRGATGALRVLMVLHELSRTGAPKVCLDAIDALGGAVSLCTLALADGPLAPRCRALGALHVVPGWSSSPLARLQRRWRMRRLARAVRVFAPDLIYLNSLVALSGLRALPVPPRPVLLHVHELDSYIQPLLDRDPDLLRQVPSRYIAVAEAVRARLVDGAAIPADRIALIHDFIPDAVLAQARATRPRERTSAAIVVGGAGYPSWRKGLGLWLQMAAHLLALVPDRPLEFRWIGVAENAELAVARHQARALGIADRIRFVPSTPEPLSHFAELDLFAQTSWEDPCPIVVLEAMALAKPVLCFAGSGGAPEEVGDAGIVIAGFDPRRMAEAAARLVADPAERASLGDRARERVARQFVASIQAPRLLQEMQRLVTPPARAASLRTLDA